MSLQGDKLMIEKQLLQDPATFFKEVVHEVAADALKVRGTRIGASQLAFIGHEFLQLNNGFFILEQSLRRYGDLKGILISYR